MRKLLYATTALTAAGLIASAAGDAAAQTQPREVPPAPPPAHVSKSAERIKLGLSGYYQQWGVVTDQSYRTRISNATGNPTAGAPLKHQPTNTVDNKHNSEICVIGQTTLDTGLTIGVNVQIEAFSEGDNIDESYLFLQSPTYGQLIIGDENNAGYLLHVTAPDGGVSLDSGDLCNIRAFETGGSGLSAGGGGALFDTPLCTTNLRLLDNDSGKFTYITPRFAGFQAGISYIPEFEAGGDNNSAVNRAGIVDANPDSGANQGINNGVGAGLNFTDTFGTVGVQASGGLLWAQTGSSGIPRGVAGTTFTNNKDLWAYNAGAQLSFAGFSVGGGWIYVPQGSRPGGLRFNGESWTVGGAYEFGPYKIGLDYMSGTNDKTTGGGKDRLEQGVVSGTYTLGPGIRLVGGVFYYDWQEENRNSENRDGIGALTGIKIGF